MFHCSFFIQGVQVEDVTIERALDELFDRYLIKELILEVHAFCLSVELQVSVVCPILDIHWRDNYLVDHVLGSHHIDRWEFLAAATM